jgi:hypothetical protein
MTVNVYRSTDTSAPVLTGQSGTLAALLQACLVAGYSAHPGAGWTSPYFDNTSKTRVFKPAGSPEAYFQVADAGPGAASFREARCAGFETMSGYNTGTGRFPTSAQQAAGYISRKSATLDATPRPWTLVADSRRFFLFVDTGDSSPNNHHFFFGAMNSYKTNDQYPFVISGRPFENNTSLSATYDKAGIRSRDISTAAAGHLERSYTGVGSAVAVGMTGESAYNLQYNDAHGGNYGMTYPCPADGGLYMSKTFINELNIPRGVLPGIWFPCHPRPLADGDTFTGNTGLVGRTFLVKNTGQGQLFLETSDTWDL